MVAAVAGQQPRWASQHITAQPSFRVATARQQCITRSTSQLSSISAAAPAPTEPYTYTSSRYSATVRPRSTSAHIASQSTVGRIHATNDVVLTGKRCESAVPNAIATTTTTTATVGVADAVLADGVRLHSAYSSRTCRRAGCGRRVAHAPGRCGAAVLRRRALASRGPYCRAAARGRRSRSTVRMAISLRSVTVTATPRSRSATLDVDFALASASRRRRAMHPGALALARAARGRRAAPAQRGAISVALKSCSTHKNFAQNSEHGKSAHVVAASRRRHRESAARR